MKSVGKILKSCLPILAAVLVLWGLLTSLGNLSGGSRQEEKQQLEAALRRAVVSCYASEGWYPPDLEYIVSHYGIRIDEAHFKVFYDVFAENVMPDIDVVIRNGSR